MCFFLFPQSSQLYYDANTGMYYYYDTESGKYQFHSRIEVPTAHPEVEQTPQRKTKDWKNRKSVKNTDRASCPDGGVRCTRTHIVIAYFCDHRDLCLLVHTQSSSTWFPIWSLVCQPPSWVSVFSIFSIQNIFLASGSCSCWIEFVFESVEQSQKGVRRAVLSIMGNLMPGGADRMLFLSL